MHHPSPSIGRPNLVRRRALLATASVVGGGLVSAGCDCHRAVPDLPFTLLNGEPHRTAALTIALGFAGVRQTPSRFLLDKRGAVVKRWQGPAGTPQLHASIERLLVEPA